MRIAALALFTLTAGCNGSIGNSSDRSDVEEARAANGPSSPKAPTADGGAPTCSSCSGAPRPVNVGGPRVWRLTNAQYDNTVASLLGDTSGLGAGFLPEVSATGFDNGSDGLVVDARQAAGYQTAAETLARTAVTSHLSDLLPCDVAQVGMDDCARKFVTTFGRRAFRRPLVDDELTAYVGLYTEGKTQVDATTGIRLVMEAMLQSPQFLFRSELGDGKADSSGLVRLTPHEVAALLSYALWNGPPDDQLAREADSGELAGDDVVAREARRLLQDDRARPAVGNFMGQLVALERLTTATRDAKLYPDWSASTADSMARGAKAFIEHVLFEATGTWDELWTAPYTFADETLAKVYRINGVTGKALSQQPLGNDRIGLLSHPALLTSYANPNASSPTKRGRFVVERLLCRTIPAPPANINMQLPAVGGAIHTTREKYQDHAAKPECSACHHLMDPIGFTMESFDAIGQARTQENGYPVDTSGQLTDSSGKAVPLSGEPALASFIASSDEARQCVAQQIFRFGLGRMNLDGDEQALADMSQKFAASGYRMADLFASLVTTKAFLYRKAN